MLWIAKNIWIHEKAEKTEVFFTKSMLSLLLIGTAVTNPYKLGD